MMKPNRIWTALFVVSLVAFGISGCDEDKGPLCEQDLMTECNLHEHGQCVEQDGEAHCVCDEDAYYRTEGITCAPIMNQCSAVCEDNADCEVGGADVGFFCDGGTCVQCNDEVACTGDDEECIGGICAVPSEGCKSNADCPLGMPKCDTESGACLCVENSDCADHVPGTSVCTDGACQCASDTDCGDLDNGDVCLEGVCICSSAAACTATKPFDGVVWECGE